jgi:hypothetical protein
MPSDISRHNKKPILRAFSVYTFQSSFKKSISATADKTTFNSFNSTTHSLHSFHCTYCLVHSFHFNNCVHFAHTTTIIPFARLHSFHRSHSTLFHALRAFHSSEFPAVLLASLTHSILFVVFTTFTCCFRFTHSLAVGSVSFITFMTCFVSFVSLDLRD